MQEFGVSAVHPLAPPAFSVAALFNAPIDIEAAVSRFNALWGKSAQARWERADGSPAETAAAAATAETADAALDGTTTAAGQAATPNPADLQILHFEVDDIHVLLTPVNAPLSIERGQLPEHRFHVVATFFAPAPTPASNTPPAPASTTPETPELARRHRILAAHVVFTQVMDALMREPGAVGVYRDELGVVLPPQMVTEMAGMLERGQAPLPLWVNVRVWRADLTFGRTLGLPAFGHLDLEVAESTRSEEDVYGLLMNVANYIVTGDTYLLPGQTLGYSATENVAITQEMAADSQPVIRLDF